MMRKILVSLFLVFIMVFGFASVSSAANWKWITSTDEATTSFDAASIKNNSYYKTYSVWIKHDYPDYIRDAIAKKFECDKPVAQLMQNIEFDYVNNTMNLVASYFYSKDGEILRSSQYDIRSFRPIAPDTIGDIVFQATFKEFKAQYGGQSSKTWKDYLK